MVVVQIYEVKTDQVLRPYIVKSPAMVLVWRTSKQQRWSWGEICAANGKQTMRIKQHLAKLSKSIRYDNLVTSVMLMCTPCYRRYHTKLPVLPTALGWPLLAQRALVCDFFEKKIAVWYFPTAKKSIFGFKIKPSHPAHIHP